MRDLVQVVAREEPRSDSARGATDGVPSTLPSPLVVALQVEDPQLSAGERLRLPVEEVHEAEPARLEALRGVVEVSIEELAVVGRWVICTSMRSASDCGMPNRWSTAGRTALNAVTEELFDLRELVEHQ